MKRTSHPASKQFLVAVVLVITTQVVSAEEGFVIRVPDYVTWKQSDYLLWQLVTNKPSTEIIARVRFLDGSGTMVTSPEIRARYWEETHAFLAFPYTGGYQKLIAIEILKVAYFEQVYDEITTTIVLDPEDDR